MKVLITRIRNGKIKIDGETKASVEKGVAAFVGIEATDTESNLIAAAKKIVNIRIFEDESGKLSQSIKEAGFSILCIPNFTLCASTKKGRRPSFEKAMQPEAAKKMFAKFVVLLQNKITVQSGTFGANMNIALELDGPVNITFEI